MSANVQEKSNRKIEQKEIIQTLVFTRWCNKYLGLVNKQIVQLDTDFSDGLKLIDLLRVLSHTKLKRQWRYPVLKRQKIGNVALAHKFMVKQNIISAVDIGKHSEFCFCKILIFLRSVFGCFLPNSLTILTFVCLKNCCSSNN